jgi:nitroreductase
MFNDSTSILSHLSTRRSGKPRDMVAPGPSDAEIAAIVDLAARTPDHGKLAPWRFVSVAAHQRDALARVIVDAYRAERPEAGRLEIEAMEQFARQAPALVVALFSPRNSATIPAWEQELSAGAACMNLLHAVHAHGYVGGWLTGWPAYNETVRDAFGANPEKIAGFIFIGSPSRPLDERPRPAPGAALSQWAPPSD